MKRPIDPKRFLTDSERSAVEQAIAEAELLSSAEVKLTIVRYCWGDLREKLLKTFHRLGLHRTARHNAVMIMVITTNRQLAIYGDRGIHQHVGERFWFDVRDEMLEAFQGDRLGEGLCAGIAKIGRELAAAYPRETTDVNEIPDDVSFEP